MRDIFKDLSDVAQDGVQILGMFEATSNINTRRNLLDPRVGKDRRFLTVARQVGLHILQDGKTPVVLDGWETGGGGVSIPKAKLVFGL